MPLKLSIFMPQMVILTQPQVVLALVLTSIGATSIGATSTGATTTGATSTDWSARSARFCNSGDC